MKPEIIVFFLVLFALSGRVCWACLVAASNAEERAKKAEEMFLDWKTRLKACADCKYVALTVVRDYLSLVNYFAEQKVEESQSYTHKDYEDECAYCREKFGCKTIYDNPLLLCLAYTMDDKNLTEHGSAIGGAWLTEMGETFLALLRTDEFEGWGE